ncbi:BRCT domain-containing protein [Horticoccus sp. 23ND18S-11]|uniref:hypothetical protein n=1 Tax=Horticoccus sp. 23ND18S-11 TaxID=3391832 RepID=UPI0039C96C7A
MSSEEIVALLRPFNRHLNLTDLATLEPWLRQNSNAHPVISKLLNVVLAIKYDQEVTGQELEDLRERIERAIDSLESPMPRMPLDQHGQPLRIPARNLVRNIEKTFDQLSGICLGVLADGKVSTEEAIAFRKWSVEFDEANHGWPFDVIRQRVERIFEDEVVSDEEREELADIMRQIIGQPAGENVARDRSTQLPFDDPMPRVAFTGSGFIPTGKFAYGTRRKVEAAIVAKGGIFEDKMPTFSTSYLVIGEFVSRDWLTTQYGRKIERAVEIREKGGALSIISEKHFVDHL